MNISDDKIRERLRTLDDSPRLDFQSTPVTDPLLDMSEAAVLIALRPGPQGLEVLLTKRAETLRQHAGQISFPGGRRDPEDEDLAATALRETWEEVGIPPETVNVYGALLRLPLVTGYAITAYVGEFESHTALVRNPAEVDELIVAPISEIADQGIHRIEQMVWNDEEFPVHYFDYGRHQVWGATGLMLDEFFRYLGLRS